MASSDIFAEDFSAGVDYLGSLRFVDRNNIGGIGICASGGFILGAAAIDKRIKAVVTSAMYDIPGFGNEADDATWQNTISTIAGKDGMTLIMASHPIRQVINLIGNINLVIFL